MTDPHTEGGPTSAADEEISLVQLANFLLRWRRIIVVFGVLGGVVGAGYGLTRTRTYSSSATFIPQGTEAASSGLALAASQFGIRLPATGSAWGPAMYLELLNSRTVLERIALDTELVIGAGDRPRTVLEILEVNEPSEAARNEQAVRALRFWIAASDIKPINGVSVTVTTPWPQVSRALAERLVREVNRFNIETRKSQAAAERQFTEQQAEEAERALREAEDRLESFLQRNRSLGSPELAFERDRLQRAVTMRQQVYTSLVQSREDAKIREVRDTPVITLLQSPQLPLRSNPRRSIRKGLIGGVVGGVVGILIALLRQLVADALRTPDRHTRQFFTLADEALPGFLRRRRRQS